uniref:Uncharacterized protein n=1 Tax=viral metagenome TaxID=1070528 RepID=A0A6C0C2U6_9ZZZZ
MNLEVLHQKLRYMKFQRATRGVVLKNQDAGNEKKELEFRFSQQDFKCT